MELDFPQGNIHRPMSEKLQNKFFEKMKNAIWAIHVSKGNAKTKGSGFCIDPHGLVLTANHVIDSEKPTQVCARRYDDDKFIGCRVILKIPHFDVALLQLDCQNSGTSSSSSSRGKKKKENINTFDYLKIDDNISRNLPVAGEVFGIGLCQSQGLHFLRGVMTYEFEGDNTNYDQLVSQVNFEEDVPDLKDTVFYTSPKFTVMKGLQCNDSNGWDVPQMHPELKYLRISFGEIGNPSGMSGSPFFNSQGKVIGIQLAAAHTLITGVSSSALYAVVKSYKDRHVNEKCCLLYAMS